MAFGRIAGLLAGGIFLSGVAFAAMTPYRAIVGVETLGLSNAAFGLVMALNAAGSALASVVLGWLSDRVEDRRAIVLACAIMGALAFGLVWAVQTAVMFVTAFCLLVPFGNALFSQTFAYSRAWLNRERPETAEFIVSLLRTMYTLAWIAVPPVAGWVAALHSAYAVFALAAVAHVGGTLAAIALWRQPGARIAPAMRGGTEDGADRPRMAVAHRFGALGVTASLAAVQLNMVLLPLVIVRDLGGSMAQVGIVASVAAAIELPAMIGWGYVAPRLGKDLILAIASGVFAVYFGAMVMASTLGQVLALQAVAAVAISALLSINISYLQEAIPGRVGLSTSLVDVTRVMSVWVAAAVFALNGGDTYAPVMAAAAGFSLCGAGLMVAARHTRLRGAVG